MNEKGKDFPARVLEANRAQMRLVPMDLEGMLGEDQPAGAVWTYVERLDLSEFYAAIRSREGRAGRPAVDPRIYLALWINATLSGVGSAREIERLSREHLAYQWICGGVPVNYHSLSDFRRAAVDRLNQLLTQSVAILMASGLVEIGRVSHDGMKVRASAGASSFRTRGSLEKLAQKQVDRLEREIDDESAPASRREQSARRRAEAERQERIERALGEMKDAEKRKRSKNGKKKTEARTSTTDPESRVMKMADGGFRPAYNIQLATDTDATVILAVEVGNDGTGRHGLLPLGRQLESRHGRNPSEWLADGGCTSIENVNEMDRRGCKVIAPLRQRTNPERKPADIRPTDSEAVQQWRARMETEQAKALYKRRGATAEWVNAQFRGQGLLRLFVRGPKNVLSVTLLHALTVNMRRTWALT